MREDQPETLHQARRFDRWKQRYLRAGLCHACAAQAAHGHALSFARVDPPRPGCAMTVLDFPVERANGWRSLSDEDRPPQVKTETTTKATPPRASATSDTRKDAQMSQAKDLAVFPGVPNQ